MNRKEAVRQYRQEEALTALGFTTDEARELRRISMTLRRWFECECNGTIERDDATNKPYHRIQYEGIYGWVDKRFSIPDRETGARKRLARIIGNRNMRIVSATLEPDTIDKCAAKVVDVSLTAYIQTDPRGAALYIIRPGDVPEGADVSSYYTRGICVY